jgi:hypothetical protein
LLIIQNKKQDQKQTMAASSNNKNNRKRSHDQHDNSSSSSSVLTKDEIAKTSSSSAIINGMNCLMKRFKMTIYGSIVLTIAIVMGLILNKNNNTTNNDIINNGIDVDAGVKSNSNFITANSLTVDSSFGTYWNTACDNDRNNSNKVWCGDGRIEPTGRTLQTSTTATSTTIRRGDQLIEIPRSLQIWEIDALKSDIVQTEHLLKARHALTDNPLPGGAFLAVYLAIEQKRLKPIPNKEEDDDDNDSSDNVGNNEDDDDDLRRASYLQSLPSWKELSDYHPILTSRSDLKMLLGHHSWNFAVVVMYQEMIDSEYNALTTASSNKVFGQLINIKEYQTARIHVLSRSFNPGSDACSAEVVKELSQSELERIQSEWGTSIIETPPKKDDDVAVDDNSLFAKGCHAMVPILDMLNSHPQPNVVYKYQIEKQAFVISAKAGIPPQWELMDSYGKYSDAHLYAKFGFVNGDGSGHTQASIALFHRPLDVQISQEFTMIPNQIIVNSTQKITGDESSPELSPMDKIPDFQKLDLKRYLQYDDGYKNCIQKDINPPEFRLKQLKWMHLANIANDSKSWIVTLQPRVPESQPKKSSNVLITELPPKIDPRKLRMDLTHIVDTCRLLALTVNDYDGTAIQVLEDNLGNNTFVVNDPGNDALEYRSLMFLARLAGTALLQYSPVTPDKEYQNVLQLNKANAIGNRDWTAGHLRLGEMQVGFFVFDDTLFRALDSFVLTCRLVYFSLNV